MIKNDFRLFYERFSNPANYADKVSDYAKPAMQWANGIGLINGMSATELAPQGKATRAQAAAILMRFCENVIK